MPNGRERRAERMRARYAGGRPDEEANRVRDVRAADGEAVLLHGRRRPVRLVEVPVEQRDRIVRRYLLFAWGAAQTVGPAAEVPLLRRSGILGR